MTRDVAASSATPGASGGAVVVVIGLLKLAKGTPFTVTTTALDLNFDGFTETRPVLLDTSILGETIDDPATSTSIQLSKQ